MNDSPVERAIRDASRDRSLATELLEQANLQELHSLCQKMINERETLARGFNATVQAWTLIDDKSPAQASPDSVAAVERIATEAMQFAREVVQAMKEKDGKAKR
jgi:hypothetical protein